MYLPTSRDIIAARNRARPVVVAAATTAAAAAAVIFCSIFPFSGSSSASASVLVWSYCSLCIPWLLREQGLRSFSRQRLIFPFEGGTGVGRPKVLYFD